MTKAELDLVLNHGRALILLSPVPSDHALGYLIIKLAKRACIEHDVRIDSEIGDNAANDYERRESGFGMGSSY